MRNSRYRFTRLVMVIDSFLIGGSGFALLVFPTRTSEMLGMPTFVDREWFARFAGLVLVALGMHVATTSRSAGDKAFARMAVFMIFISAAIATSIYQAPGNFTGWRWFAVISGGLWTLLYTVTLPIKTIGLQDDEATSP